MCLHPFILGCLLVRAGRRTCKVEFTLPIPPVVVVVVVPPTGIAILDVA